MSLPHSATSARHEHGLGGLLMIQVFKVVCHAADSVGIKGIHLTSTTLGHKLYRKFQFSESPYGAPMYLKPLTEIRDYLRAIGENWQSPWS